MIGTKLNFLSNLANDRDQWENILLRIASREMRRGIAI